VSEQRPSKPMSIEQMRDLADCCPQRCHEALLWGAAEIERLRAALESVPCSCDARENPEWEHEKTCAVYIADKALNRPVEEPVND